MNRYVYIALSISGRYMTIEEIVNAINNSPNNIYMTRNMVYYYLKKYHNKLYDRIIINARCHKFGLL